jgi:suppressor of cytokine signaling 6/7
MPASMDDENHDCNNDSRLKFFSLRKKKRQNTKTQDGSSTKNSGVFCTLRKRFQKKFQNNGQNKVKAMEITNCESGEGTSGMSTEFSRIHFSAPSSEDIDSVVAEPVAARITDSRPLPLRPEDEFEEMITDQMSHLMRYGKWLLYYSDDSVLYSCCLSSTAWFWVNLDVIAAQHKLKYEPNGSFLVRESQTKWSQFTLSFRSGGKTLHCRIDYVKGHGWTFFDCFNSPTVHQLILDTMKHSQNSVFGFVKQNSRLQPPFPVRLTNPVNQPISTLQHMCRFKIRQHVTVADVTGLPLPDKLKDYVKEKEAIAGGIGCC